MNTIQKTHTGHTGAQPGASAHGLSSSLILLLASGAGLAVASLYYSQPMLGVLADDIGHIRGRRPGLRRAGDGRGDRRKTAIALAR